MRVIYVNNQIAAILFDNPAQVSEQPLVEYMESTLLSNLQFDAPEHRLVTFALQKPEEVQ